ncbi:MAG: hypothetical protein IJ137_01980 [Eubacterium sp.]|nr:hypothetical protein [Eubacterium sp.]
MKRFTFEEFTDYAAEHIKDKLPPEYKNAAVSITEIEKPNFSYTGMQVARPGTLVVPVINLDKFYEDYRAGQSLDRVLDEMASFRDRPFERADLPSFTDYSAVKDLLFIRVMNQEENKDYLANAVHQETDGLAVTANILLNGDMKGADEIASTVVTRPLLEDWGISEDQVMKDAADNAQTLFPAKHMSLDGMLMMMGSSLDIPGEELPAPQVPLVVLTNDKQIDGAAAMMYPGMMEEIAGEVGSDFYILPSSRHEVLLMPVNVEMDLKTLENMVREVNATVVSAEDYLSDEVYYYDAADRMIERARTHEAKQMEKEARSGDRAEDADGKMPARQDKPRRESVLGRLNEKKAQVAGRAKSMPNDRSHEMVM